MLTCSNFLFLLNTYTILYYDASIAIKKKEECNISIKCVLSLVVHACEEVERIVEKKKQEMTYVNGLCKLIAIPLPTKEKHFTAFM